MATAHTRNMNSLAPRALLGVRNWKHAIIPTTLLAVVNVHQQIDPQKRRPIQMVEIQVQNPHKLPHKILSGHRHKIQRHKQHNRLRLSHQRLRRQRLGHQRLRRQLLGHQRLRQLRLGHQPLRHHRLNRQLQHRAHLLPRNPAHRRRPLQQQQKSHNRTTESADRKVS